MLSFYFQVSSNSIVIKCRKYLYENAENTLMSVVFARNRIIMVHRGISRMSEKKYYRRLLDDKLDIYIQTFGAVLLEGPKWCGKTTTEGKHARSILLCCLRI